MLACFNRWPWWLWGVEASLWAEEGGAGGREGLSPGAQGGVHANQEGQLVGDHEHLEVKSVVRSLTLNIYRSNTVKEVFYAGGWVCVFYGQQYAWVFTGNMQMCDKPLWNVEFLPIRTGVFYAVLGLKRN